MSCFPGTEPDVTGATRAQSASEPGWGGRITHPAFGEHGRDPGDLALGQTWQLQSVRPLPSLTSFATPAGLNLGGRATDFTHAETCLSKAQCCSSGSVGGRRAPLPLLCWVLSMSGGGGGGDLEGGSGRARLRAVANRRRRLNRRGRLSERGGGGFFRRPEGSSVS